MSQVTAGPEQSVLVALVQLLQLSAQFNFRMLGDPHSHSQARKRAVCVLLHRELTRKLRLALEPYGIVRFLAVQIQAICRAATVFRKMAFLRVK